MSNQTTRPGYIPLTLELPPDVVAQITAAASTHGISVSSYVMVAHAIAQEQVPLSMLADIGEVFTNDRAVLEALAK